MANGYGNKEATVVRSGKMARQRQERRKSPETEISLS